MRLLLLILFCCGLCSASLFSNRTKNGLVFQYSFNEDSSGGTLVPDDGTSVYSPGPLQMDTRAARFLTDSTGVDIYGSEDWALQSQGTMGPFLAAAIQENQPNPAFRATYSLDFWMLHDATIPTAQVVFGFGNFGTSNPGGCNFIDVPGIPLHGGFALCMSTSSIWMDTDFDHFFVTGTLQIFHLAVVIRRSPGDLGVNDVASASIYLNGVHSHTFNGSVKLNYNVWDQSAHFVIAPQDANGNYWKGNLYLVAFYNRSLTVDEVVQNYNAGLPNRIPITPNMTVVGLEDHSLSIALTSTDAESESRVLWIQTLPASGRLMYTPTIGSEVQITSVPYALSRNDTDSVVYIGNPNHFGSDLFSYSALNVAASVRGWVHITLNITNDAPVPHNMSVVLVDRLTQVIALNITDPENHVIELIRIERLPAVGWLIHPVTNATLLSVPTTVLCVLGVCRIKFRSELTTQQDGVLGTDSFTYSAADAGNHSLTIATVLVTITTELVPLPNSSIVLEDTRSWIRLQGLNLAEPDAFRVILVSLPSTGALYQGTRAITSADLLVPLLNHTGLVLFQAGQDVTGNTSVEYALVSSIGRRSAVVTQHIEIQAVNDEPVLSCPGPAAGESAVVFAMTPFGVVDPDPETDLYYARVELISSAFFKKMTLFQGRYETELTFTEGDFVDAYLAVFHGSRRAVAEAIQTIGVATSTNPGTLRVTLLDGAFEVVCNSNYTVASDTASLLGQASNAGTALIIALVLVICVPVVLCKLAGYTHEKFNAGDVSVQNLREFIAKRGDNL